MSDAVTVALIATTPPTLLAVAALWKIHQGNKTSDKIEPKVGIVEEKVDGRFSELLKALLKLTQEDGYKDGVAAGTQAEKGKRP